MAEVETTRDGAVTTIALNRPDKLNAFDAAQHKAFSTALKEAADAEVRAVVLTGSGRGFCVGQDLTELSGGDRDVAGLLRERWNRHVLGLQGLEKPVLAAVNGAAAGAGLSLACACDLRIAADKAAFVPAFISVGLVPDTGGSWLVPQLLGYSRAFEWMCSGRKIDAQEALAGARLGGRRHGRGGGKDAGAGGRAGRAAHPGDRDDEAPLPARGHHGSRISSSSRRSSRSPPPGPRTSREGVAFLEKREPRFSGR